MKKTLKILSFSAALGILFLLGMFVYFAQELPNPQQIIAQGMSQSTKIYDRTGKILLYEIHGSKKRTVIPLKDIPLYVREATVAIEDEDFYHHIGIQPRSILRAIMNNILHRKFAQGGSTISQQFIKNSMLTPHKSIIRKIKEIILTLELERKYSKDQILAFYLNQIPYGSNAYGIEAASETFFGKEAKDLDLAQSALLAALPNAPSYYSPYGNHTEELKKRQGFILDKMARLGYISARQADQAKREQLKFSPLSETKGIKAPHFVMFVKEYLEKKYGREALFKKGLKVVTTLDWDLQKKAQETVKKAVARNIRRYNAFNAALFAVDPKTGQILAMVGSKDYFSSPEPKGCTPGRNCKFEPNVNVTLRLRQPGSAFKPFAYATAFEKGYTPNTILFDLETVFKSPGVSYIPHNYDGKFRGPVTMRQALAESLNVPSVKTLYLAGIQDTIKTAQNMGISTIGSGAYHGLSLVLGSAEVKLSEITSAFGVFANDGVKVQPAFILKVTDNKGNVLQQYQKKQRRVLPSKVARMINDILSDNEARTPMFGPRSSLFIAGYDVAAKTGTTDQYRNGWTVGYSSDIAAGVWAGNNDNSRMYKGAGIYVAAPIWKTFMKYALEKIKEKQGLPKPDQIPQTGKSVLDGQFYSEKIVRIDKASGRLATPLTPPEMIEEKSYKQIHCILYYVKKDNPLGEVPAPDQRDPAFQDWERPVIEWLKSQPDSSIYNQPLPTEYDNIHIPENKPSLKILFPSQDAVITNSSLKVKVEASGRFPIRQVDFFLDNNLQMTDTSPPFQEIINLTGVAKGYHKLTVKAYDVYLNSDQKQIQFFRQGSSNF